jgi:hypothetical protein
VVPRANVVDLRRTPTPVPRPVSPPRVDPIRAVDFPRVLGRLVRPLPPVARARLLFHLYSFRSVSGFVVASVLVVSILAFGRTVGGAQGDADAAFALANEGIRQLTLAGTALAATRWHDAETAGTAAAAAFRQAGDALGRVPGPVRVGLYAAPRLNARFRSARHLAAAGERLGTAVQSVGAFGERVLVTSDSGVAIPVLVAHAPELAPAITAAEEGIEELAAVDVGSFDEPTRTTLARAQDLLPIVRKLLSDARNAVTVLPELLGSEQPREYLVVFQNAAERRPTGGFWGSLLGVRFDRGVPAITDAPGRGPYDVDDRLPPIAAPNPILRVTNRWTLHDANWSAAFPASADKGLALYEEARGYRVDGVLAFTSTLLPHLLSVTGPVTLPDGTVLNPTDALSILQRRVEFGYDRAANQPKAVVAQLFTALAGRFSNLLPTDVARVAAVLRDAAFARDIQVFAAEPKLQARVEAAGWAGTLEPGTFDTVGVFGANLGGGKADAVTDDSLTVSVSIDASGLVTDTLTYIRTHNGAPVDPLVGGTNRSFIRFLVPDGARLTSASGFGSPDPATFFSLAPGARSDSDADAFNASAAGVGATRVTREGPFTAFGGWLDVPPRETRAVQVAYALPGQLERSGALSPERTYRIRLLHQSGSAPTVLLRVLLPPKARLIVASIPLARRGVAYEGSFLLTRDSDVTILYR